MSSSSISNDSRRLLLDTATRMFAKDGYHAVSVAKLCREAGIANGTFYLYFQNKEEIFAAVAAHALEALALRLRSAERHTLDAKQREFYDITAIVSYIEDHHNLFKVLLTEHGLRDQNRDSIMDMFANQRKKELAAGVKRGEYRSDLNPEMAAYAELGLTNEILQRWVRRPQTISRRRLIENLKNIRARLLFD
jgi:AcrR family transcriptional regulator